MLYWILNWHNKFAHSCSFGVLCVSFVNTYEFFFIMLLSLFVLLWDVGFDCINS